METLKRCWGWVAAKARWITAKVGGAIRWAVAKVWDAIKRCARWIAAAARWVYRTLLVRVPLGLLLLLGLGFAAAAVAWFVFVLHRWQTAANPDDFKLGPIGDALGPIASALTMFGLIVSFEQRRRDLKRAAVDRQADLTRAQNERTADLTRIAGERQADLTRAQNERTADLNRIACERTADHRTEQRKRRADLRRAQAERHADALAAHRDQLALAYVAWFDKAVLFVVDATNRLSASLGTKNNNTVNDTPRRRSL